MQNLEFEQPTETFGLNRYLSLAWHWAWPMLLVGILAAGATYFVSKRTTPVYQATATMLVNVAPASTTSSYGIAVSSSQITTTYAQMLTKSTMLDEVAKELGLPKVDPASVTAQVITGAQLISLTAESTDPKLAADIANTLFNVFKGQIVDMQTVGFTVSVNQLQSQITAMDQQINKTNADLAAATDPTEINSLQALLASYRQIYANLQNNLNQVQLSIAQTTSSVVLVEAAAIPEVPVRPKTKQNTVLAGLFGILLVGGVMFGLDALDDTIKSPEEITRKLGLPVLAVVSHFETEEGLPITEDQPRSPVSEAFRSLRTNVQFAGVGLDKPLRTILVTSPNPREGKTTVAVNLGIVLAQNGRRVSIVDADLRRPSVHRQLGLKNLTGLSQVFVQAEAGLNGSLQQTRTANLKAVTSGSLPPNPSELLGSQRMGAILDELKASSEFVILDTPPVLAVTDAAVMLPMVEGVLLVMKPGYTRLATARQCIEQLRRMGANILGVALNDVDLRRSRYSYYYYNREHYYHSYGDGNDSKPKKKFRFWVNLKPDGKVKK